VPDERKRSIYSPGIVVITSRSPSISFKASSLSAATTRCLPFEATRAYVIVSDIATASSARSWWTHHICR
jgi:hypothetical protein